MPLFSLNNVQNNEILKKRSKYSFYYNHKVPRNFLNVNCGYLYIVRFYCIFINKFVYKYGFSEDIEQRFKTLNYEYGCHNQNSNGNNFIVLYVVKNCTKKRDENKFKNMLKFHKENVIIKNRVKQECVKISIESYEIIKNTIELNYSEANIYKNFYEIKKLGDELYENF